MQVHYDEGIANRIDPEPCAGIREDIGEASAGGRAGQPLSRDRKLNEVGADPGPLCGGLHRSLVAYGWRTLQQTFSA